MTINIIFQIDVPSIFTNPKDTEDYFEKLVKLATVFNASEKDARRELNKSLSFEIKLLQVIDKNIDNLKNLLKILHCHFNNYSNNYLAHLFFVILTNFILFSQTQVPNIGNRTVLTINELDNKYPIVNWSMHFNALIPFKNFKDDDQIVVYNPHLIDKLFDLISNTPEEIIINYLYSRFIIDVYDTILYGTTNSKSNCFGEIIDSKIWRTAANALYIRDHFNMSNKIEALKLIDNIRDTTKKLITDVS